MWRFSRWKWYRAIDDAFVQLSIYPDVEIRRGDLTERERFVGTCAEGLKSHNIYFDESNASDI